MQDSPGRRQARTALLDLLLTAGAAGGATAAAEALLHASGVAGPGVYSPWLHGMAVAAAAAGGASVYSLWRGRIARHRLQRMMDVSEAWLRGALSLRIAEHRSDDLAELARQLNTIAEHLEQDEQDLVRLREQSARLSDQLRALVVDEERERFARELHDGVKQHLFSLSMTSSALVARLSPVKGIDQEARTMLREVEATSKTVQRALTRLIEDLRPAPLQEQGLTKALNDYALLFGAREHILVYLDVQGSDALLPPSVSEALYRVAQEALHNVARHARATRVDACLRCLPEMVQLDLRDNGVGFDVSQVRRGLGLGNMQDRMLSVGGRLQIDSRSGHGTRVRAEVVLAERDSARGETLGDAGRPDPTPENWAWLGRRLVIPVGQPWPWLPADQAHLRTPLIGADRAPVSVRRVRGGLGFGTRYVLADRDGVALATVSQRRSGYEWREAGSRWALRYVRGPRGGLRMVLTRNGQPLAATQQQGRLLDVWCEMVYDGRGYRFACSGGLGRRCTLTDATGEVVLALSGGPLPTIDLGRVVALPLLVMAAVVAVDNRAVAAGDGAAVPSELGTGVRE